MVPSFALTALDSDVVKPACLYMRLLIPTLIPEKPGRVVREICPRLLNYLFFGFAKHSTDSGYFQGGIYFL